MEEEMRTVEGLYRVYEERTFDIFSIEFLQWVAGSRAFDEMSLLNRLLCYIQAKDRDTSIVRPKEWWESIGRCILGNEARPIYLIEMVNETVLYDSDTGEKVSSTGISGSEMAEAIKYGLVTKKTNNVGAKITQYYTLSDTRVVDYDRFDRFKDEYQKVISVNRVLSMMSKLGIEFEICGDDYVGNSYFNGEKAIIANTDEYEIKVKAMIDAIVNSLDLSMDSNISKVARKFISESMRCFITKKSDADMIEVVEILEMEQLMDYKGLTEAINNMYVISSELIRMISPASTNIDVSRLKKVNELLSILEANKARALLGG